MVMKKAKPDAAEGEGRGSMVQAVLTAITGEEKRVE